MRRHTPTQRDHPSVRRSSFGNGEATEETNPLCHAILVCPFFLFFFTAHAPPSSLLVGRRVSFHSQQRNMAGMQRPPLEVEGASLLRQHIACSLLSNRPVRIHNIHADRSDARQQGLQDYEVNFLKFVVRCTQDSKLEVAPSKTLLTFTPGVILGGEFSHEVPTTRAVTYIAEAALLFLPFGKYKSVVTFTGATQHRLDLSLDTMRTVTLRWAQLFGIDGVSLRQVRRGAPPGGGGCAVLTVPVVRKLRSVNVVKRGKCRRVRGIAFSSNTSGDLTKTVASAAKGILLQLLPDVYVVTDSYHHPPQRDESGSGNVRELKKNGYGVMLVSEWTEATCVQSQEVIAAPGDDPNDVGVKAAKLLLDQIAAGGCVDAHHQALVLLWMVLAPAEVSTVRFGPMTPTAVSAMMLCEEYFGVSCAVKDEVDGHGGRSVVVSCIGSNTVNLVKHTT